jgi:hypothetical protein
MPAVLHATNLLAPFRGTSPANPDTGERVKQTENIQQPENDGNHHDAVEDGLDGSLHGDEAIHQPQKNTHDNENFQDLEQRHDLLPSLFRVLDFAD